MSTPRLNRIFTVTASRESVTADTLIEWRFNQYSAEPLQRYMGLFASTLPSTGKYAWIETGDATLPFGWVDSAQGIVDTEITDLELGANSVNDDGSPNSILPAPGGLLEHDAIYGKEVRIYPANESGADYISFIAEGRTEYPTNDAKHGQFFFIKVRPGTFQHVGNNFDLFENEEILLSVEGQVTSSEFAEPIAYPGIWGEFNEKGIQQSIASAGDILDFDSEQTASLVVRYRNDLLGGESVIDDLGREWRVSSSRPIIDRRYIRYELVRTIAS